MKHKICKKYLVFPVNTYGVPKMLYFFSNGKETYKLDIKLDNINPNFKAYIDVSRFIGTEIELSVAPEMDIRFEESDTAYTVSPYSEPLRPQVHFSAKNGWINDPNGLIYENGTYHMFYQYNPADTEWGNMHWGHAVSDDLIHWEECDIAMFPDERGAMFSGCAVCDEKNLLGKNNGSRKASLLFFTATEPYSQYLAYSADGFKTIENYGKSPIVPQISDENRDPKVVFCDELGCYIMILYLDGDEYALLKSDNLTSWNEFQRVHIKGDNECPDIFQVIASDGTQKWIIIGAHDRYIVGSFSGGKFVAEQEEMSLHSGSAAYAGQTYANMPEGRTVRVVWERWYAQVSDFCGQMGIPTEMSLSEHNGKYYLAAMPVKEIENLFKNTAVYGGIGINQNDKFTVPIEDTAQFITIKGDIPNSGEITVSVFGRNINIDFAENKIKIGNTVSPLSVTHTGMDITLIVDRCSIELFADGGKVAVACIDNDTVCDRNLPYCEIVADTDFTVDELEITSLNSIWGENI